MSFYLVSYQLRKEGFVKVGVGRAGDYRNFKTVSSVGKVEEWSDIDELFNEWDSWKAVKI